MTSSDLNKRHLLYYGLIAIPVAFAGFPLYIQAPDFYATEYGLSLTLIGTLLLFIRLFDAVQDPFIGWLVDRQNGHFKKLVAISGLILCLSIFALFNIVIITPAVWFALCMLLSVTAYSLLTITLGAYAARWTANSFDQTRIAGTRETFGLIGLITAVSIPPLLTPYVGKDHVFIWYTAILAVLTIFGILSFARLPVKTLKTPTQTSRHILSSLSHMSQDNRRFFAVYLVSMLASSIPAILVIFFVRDLLGAENMIGIFLLLYFLSGAVGIPIWRKISSHLGKFPTWAIAHILAVMSFIGALFLGAADIWAYAFVCMTSGLALGADLTLPPSILSDKLHAQDKIDVSGVYYAVLAFILKASLALASVIALPLLESFGFKPETINDSSALLALSATYALIPCILKLLSAALIYVFFIHPPTGDKNEILHTIHPHHRSHHHVNKL